MKKLFKICLILFIAILLFGVILFFTYWSTWKKNSNHYLKQTEIYYNSLIKFSTENNKYKYMQNTKDYIYTLYPIKIVGKNKEVLGYIKTNNKVIVSLEDINQNFINALTSTEDQYYFKHNGISVTGIARAFINNILNMRLGEGGSTITQQLSKLLFSNQEKTIKRKMNEFFTAMSIEKNYTKNDILFMYTNLIYFGYNIYGVGLASRAYFGKSASELSIPEAALLVTLISNPSFYNPYKHLSNTKKKHLAVLINMYQQGYIKKEEVISIYNNFWKNPTLLQQVSLPKSTYSNNKGLYVIEEIRRFLSRNFGSGYLDELQGSTIYTTIDLNVQSHLDTKNAELMSFIKNQSPLPQVDRNLIESANIVSEANTGKILAFNGGTQFSKNNQFNRAFQAKRQVGSTIKPFLYAVGLDLHEITPYTVFEDIPIEVEFKNKVTWDVNNYNESYRGYLNVSDAIKRSSNVIAVQVTDKIGINNLQNFFQKALGITVKEARELFPDYQYSLALGAVNLTPLQLNQLYQIIANDGEREELYYISEIKDLSGNILYKHKNKSQKILSKEASFLIQDILKKVLQPGGSGNYVKRNHHFISEVAGKSGTTQKNRDIWFSGFTKNIVITSWIGQDQNKSMGNNFVGGRQSGLLFGNIMQFTDKYYTAPPFKLEKDYNIVKSPVDLLTGYLPTPNTLFLGVGLFIKGTEPKRTEFMSVEEQIRIAKQKKILTPKQEQKIISEYFNPIVNKEIHSEETLDRVEDQE